MPALVEQDPLAGGAQHGIGIGQPKHAVVGERDHLGGQEHADLAAKAAQVAQHHERAVRPVRLDLLAAEALSQHAQPAGVLVLLEHEQLDGPGVSGVAGLVGEAPDSLAVAGFAELEAGYRARYRFAAAPGFERLSEGGVERAAVAILEVGEPAGARRLGRHPAPA